MSIKNLFIIAILLVFSGTVASLAVKSDQVSGTWRYRMTVVVETPEGIRTGSAVREMGNSTPLFRFPDVGNPAGVRGEAVVVDLGERGVLFALISHLSDNEFYNAFPVPGNRPGNGGASPAGIKYYRSLKTGTEGTLDPAQFPGYPKLVTFTDIKDPTSVTLAQVWKRNERGHYELSDDHFEELFGEGVKLKEITLEIADGSVTWGLVDEYLPATFSDVVIEGWRQLSFKERQRLYELTGFKRGNLQ